MPDSERVLGALLEFKEATKDRFDKLEGSTNGRFDKLELKVDALNQFKWRVAGGAAALSVVLAGLVEIVHVAISK